MNTYWDEFLEQYGDEIFDWSLRNILETFWHYCDGGPKAVHELQVKRRRDSIHEIREIEIPR